MAKEDERKGHRAKSSVGAYVMSKDDEEMFVSPPTLMPPHLAPT